MQAYYIEVLPFIAVPYSLTYTATEPLTVGTLVDITVKNIKTKGLVKSVSTVSPQSNFKYLPIDKILYNEPVIFEDGIKIIEWISRYYACSLPVALETALPPQLRQGKPFPRYYTLHITDVLPQFDARCHQ